MIPTSVPRPRSAALASLVPQAAAAACLLAATAGAQRGAEPLRVVSASRGVYDFETGRVDLRAAPKKGATGVFCYVNTDTVGFFATPRVGEEIVDWGILGGTAGTKCVGLSDIVSSFTFTYATTSLDPDLGGPGASMTLLFYEDYQGYGQDSGNCPVASFAFSGLPGFSGTSTGIGAAYQVQVDLSGGDEFCLPDGAFGFGYRGDGFTGPLLCLTGDGAGGPEPCTGNLDTFDFWIPDTKGVYAGSSFCQGGPCGFSSWDLALARADLTANPASVAVRNAAPNPPGSLTCTAPVLGGTLDLSVLCPAGYTAAFCFAFDTQVTIPLSAGQVLLTADLGGSGELLSGSGIATGFAGTTVGGASSFAAATPVPKNLELCGFTLSVQGLCAFGLTPFALSSACDLTVGG